MSKRFGNITTPRDLREDGIEAAAVRLLIFQTHYRQQLDLTDDALAAAREGTRRLGEFAGRFIGAARRASADWDGAAERLEVEVREALDDDLNAPRAVAAVFDFVREGNRLLDGGAPPSDRAGAAWQLADRALDIAHQHARVEVGAGGGPGSPLADDPPAGAVDRLDWAKSWASRRAEAKQSRNFAEADRIRNLLADNGFDVRDRRDGSGEVVARGG